MNDYTKLALAFQNESNPVKRDRIFMKLDTMVRSIIFRYVRAFRSSGFSIIELQSVCRVECYEGLSRFNSELSEYNTFLSKSLFGAIQNYIRDNTDTIHIPANQKLKIGKAIREWNKAKSENPELEMPSEIEEMINLNNIASLNVENSEGESWISSVKSPEWTIADKELILKETRSLICKALMSIPKHQRTAFWKTYHDNIALRDTANRMNVSHQTIDNWSTKAIKQLKQNLINFRSELLEVA